MEKSLFIGFYSVLQIKDGKYYGIRNHDDAAFYELSRNEFKEKLQSYKNVCVNSWSKELQSDYLEMNAIFDSMTE